jgi:hypothetical protein
MMKKYLKRGLMKKKENDMMCKKIEKEIEKIKIYTGPIF